LLSQIYEPTAGIVNITGKISPLLNLTHGIEMELTGMDNAILRGTILGLTREQMVDKAEEIASFSGLGDYFHMPIRTYSSGMMMRLAFAISTCIKPDILLIDEVFGTGDADFREKAQARMSSLLEQSSIVVIANHSDGLVKQICNKGLLLEGGRLKAFGPINEVIDAYHQKGKGAVTG
jgi:ABC-2 type transport system ATP-binding protein